MAVAVNTTSTAVYEGSGAATGSGTGGNALTFPAALANAAYIIVVATNNSGGLATGFTVTGITGIAQIGSAVISGTLQIVYWGALIASTTAGQAAPVVHWTGGNATQDVYAYDWLLSGVDQTAFATSFTNVASYGPTSATNPTLAVTRAANGLVLCTFANNLAQDVTTLTVGGSSVLNFHGNSVSINMVGGNQAGASGSVTFTPSAYSPAQTSIGLGLNVVPVGGANVQYTSNLVLTSGSVQTVTRTVG